MSIPSRHVGPAVLPSPAARPVPPHQPQGQARARADHTRQPLLQLRGDEDTATIHPVSHGARERPAAESTPAVLDGGCGLGGRARQRHRLGWCWGPTSCGSRDALGRCECSG